ncbi:MAG: SDR family NAD(P)-dependent oxidoreductase [Candidatus Tectomicrobia bacterium]|uniref:SDR family NAD(P)-dependent oxidoreductase n=1 Tax=Tectimicrobiota bacterium TaxID=2528274 RepID=A0A932GM38_UNCTE|nr:SDR family NAD(P)-dependent oxidoreductase [Candidatus Tectomicrobia bacterium]
MMKAIIVGASSGIGAALAHVLIQHGYRVGLVARRLPLLLELQKKLGPTSFVKQADIADTAAGRERLYELIREIGGVDLVVISAGTGFINPSLDWDLEEQTIAVNVSGFTAVADVAMHWFLKQSSGHLVSISSIAALRGSGEAPAYNASKAFVSNYMDGLRQKVTKLGVPIIITDIQAGFVDTAMARGEGLFWVASPEKAAVQIYQAIRKKRKHAYVTKRWRLIGWFLKFAPNNLYDRLV